MKRIFTALFFFLISVLAFSQQEAQFTQNMFTNMAINPGYAGINKQICVTSLFRQQWSGFEDPYGNKGAPQTILLTVDAPVRVLRGGLGVTVIKISWDLKIILEQSWLMHIISPLVLVFWALASRLDSSTKPSTLMVFILLMWMILCC